MTNTNTYKISFSRWQAIFDANLIIERFEFVLCVLQSCMYTSRSYGLQNHNNDWFRGVEGWNQWKINIIFEIIRENWISKHNGGHRRKRKYIFIRSKFDWWVFFFHMKFLQNTSFIEEYTKNGKTHWWLIWVDNRCHWIY